MAHFTRKLLWALLLITIVIPAARATTDASSADAQHSSQRITVIVGGDVMAPMRLKETAFRIGDPQENYFGSLLRGLRPIVEPADIAFANLETPISVSEPVTPRPFVFNAPSHYVKSLKWLGFDVLSVINNHSLDQKLAGVRETNVALEREGILSVGAANDRDTALAGRVFDVRGVKVGFLAFTGFINGGNHVALSSRSPYLNLTERTRDLHDAVDRMRARVDVLILSVHWGVEYEAKPRSWQKTLARQLHQRGVDILVGHHPHVLQPLELFREAKSGRWCMTLYSLGNLISNQEAWYSPRASNAHGGRTRDSAMIELHLSKRGIHAYRVHPLWIDNWRGPEEGIRTVRITDELLRLEAQIQRLRPSPERSFLLERKQLLNNRYVSIFRSLGLKVPPFPVPAPQTGQVQRTIASTRTQR